MGTEMEHTAQPVQDKAQVLELIEQARPALRELGVRRMGLFGSFVRGEQHAGSDVDLLVEFEPGRKSFDNFMALSFMLEELLGRRVELLTPESLSPHLGPQIMGEVEQHLIQCCAEQDSQDEERKNRSAGEHRS